MTEQSAKNTAFKELRENGEKSTKRTSKVPNESNFTPSTNEYGKGMFTQVIYTEKKSFINIFVIKICSITI